MDKQPQMSKIEQFGLISGIIGLVADLIGLTTFLLGMWGLQQADNSGVSMSTLLKVLTMFLMFYGWITISWFLARRSFVRRNRRRKYDFGGTVSNTVVSVGLFVAPIYLLWLIALVAGTVDESNYREAAQIEATRVAVTMLTPAPTVEAGQPEPTPIVPKSVDEIISQKRGADLSAVIPLGIFLGLPIAFGIYLGIMALIDGAITNLMPVVHPDMAHVASAKPPVEQQK